MIAFHDPCWTKNIFPRKVKAGGRNIVFTECQTRWYFYLIDLSAVLAAQTKGGSSTSRAKVRRHGLPLYGYLAGGSKAYDKESLDQISHTGYY